MEEDSSSIGSNVDDDDDGSTDGLGDSVADSSSAGDVDAGTDSEATSDATTTSDSDATTETATDTEENGESTQGIELPGQFAITVENSAAEPTSSSQPIALVFDHAQLVRHGAAPDGRDLRIIYHIGQTSELRTPYELDHDSAWNRADTRVWFSARASIQPRTSDVDNYHLIVGASEADPRAEGQVFTISDGFEGNAVDPSRWQLVSQGNATAQVESGWLRLNAQSPAGSSASIEIHSSGRSQRSALLFEARAWVSDIQGDGSCLRSFVVGASSAPTEILRSAIALSGDRYWYIRTEGGGQSVSGGQTPADGDWHLYQIRWVDDQVDAYEDGRLVFRATAAAEYPSPNSGWTQLMSGLRVGASGCDKAMAIEQRIDWIRMRPIIDPDPTAYLQSGQLP